MVLSSRCPVVPLSSRLPTYPSLCAFLRLFATDVSRLLAMESATSRCIEVCDWLFPGAPQSRRPVVPSSRSPALPDLTDLNRRQPTLSEAKKMSASDRLSLTPAGGRRSEKTRQIRVSTMSAFRPQERIRPQLTAFNRAQSRSVALKKIKRSGRRPSTEC